jgi:hypothetical protein
MIGTKLFILHMVFALPGILYARTFSPENSSIIYFIVYSIYASIFCGYFLKNYQQYVIYSKNYEKIYRIILIFFILYTIILLIFEKPNGLASIFNRDRALRLDLLESTIKPFFTKYFLLFSSSLLFCFVGIFSATIGKFSNLIMGVVVCYLVDGITDSRSTVLAFALGYGTARFVLFKIQKKDIFYGFFAILTLPVFFLLGQESIEDGVLFLRVYAYFTAPPLLTMEVVNQVGYPLLNSYLELFFWPIETVFGEIFNTRYEYEYYLLSNGLEMNVLIPSYASFYNLHDFIAFTVINFIILLFVGLIYLINKKSYYITGAFILTLFSPLSDILNPYLSEKGFFLVIVLVTLLALKKFSRLCAE